MKRFSGACLPLKPAVCSLTKLHSAPLVKMGQRYNKHNLAQLNCYQIYINDIQCAVLYTFSNLRVQYNTHFLLSVCVSDDELLIHLQGEDSHSADKNKCVCCCSDTRSQRERQRLRESSYCNSALIFIPVATLTAFTL